MGPEPRGTRITTAVPPSVPFQRFVVMPRLVLASTSPYRRGVTRAARGAVRVRFAARRGRRLETYRRFPSCAREPTSAQKAASVAALHADAVVVGSDQVVDFEGRVFGKPGNAEDATGQLLAMSGKAHEIVTAVSVIHPDGICDYLDATVLWMRSLERSEIALRRRRRTLGLRRLL